MFAAAAATATAALTRLLVAHLIVELSCDVPCMFAFFISRRIRSVARPNCAPHTQEVLGHFCLRHIRMHTVPAYGWFLISLTQKHKVSHVSLPRARDRWVSGYFNWVGLRICNSSLVARWSMKIDQSRTHSLTHKLVSGWSGKNSIWRRWPAGCAPDHQGDANTSLSIWLFLMMFNLIALARRWIAMWLTTISPQLNLIKHISSHSQLSRWWTYLLCVRHWCRVVHRHHLDHGRSCSD